MVGFSYDDPTVEEEDPNNQSSKLKNSGDPFDLSSVIELDDFSLSFADSFLDFDSIMDLIEENPNPCLVEPKIEPDLVDSDSEKLGVVENHIEMEKDGFFRETVFDNPDVMNLKTELVLVDSSIAESGVGEKSIEMAKDGYCGETAIENSNGDGSEKLGNLDSLKDVYCKEIAIENSDGDESEKLGNLDSLKDGYCGETTVDNSNEDGSEKLGNLDSLKVSLEGMLGASVVGDENGKMCSEIVSANGGGTVSSEDDSEDSSESESGSSSSSSAASSSSSEEEEDDDDDDDDKEKVDKEMDVEEGEIRDSDVEKMVGWSDDDVDEEDDVVKGPLMSKNEVKDLPPVPPVEVTLQPYHQTLPVGVVLSMMGSQVIVEGVEKHNPLNEGSILWITETRSSLGMVDEIFGPVKNPYYIVRYNSENEVPVGIQMGTSISFVPEFVSHVLNDKNLYQKGYDASGKNDEEVTDDEAEFSDDEKEAEYKRMMKMTKRGTNEQRNGNKKKDRRQNKNHRGNWKNGQNTTTPETPAGRSQLQSDQNQHFSPSVTASQDRGSLGTGHGFAGGLGFVPPFPQLAPIPGFMAPSNGMWPGGMPAQQQQQQQQSLVFNNGFPANGMQWLQQNHQLQMGQMPLINGMPFQQQQNQHPQLGQMPVMNGMPFQQQFDSNQGFPNNVLQGGQPNVCVGPTFSPWPGFAGQVGFNQVPLGMGLPGQQGRPPMNLGQQGFPQQNHDLQSPSNGGEASPTFNQGAYSGQARRPYRRGGGRFGGGRNRQQSK